MSEIQLEVPDIGDAPMEAGGADVGFRPLPDTDDSGTSDDAHHGPEDDSTDSDDLDPKERSRRRKERKEKRKAKKEELQKRWDERREPARPSSQRRVVYTNSWQVDTTSRLVLREFEGAAKCQGATIIEGFPSKGLASSLVAKTIIDERKLPLIGELASMGFTTSVRISHGSAMHSCRIYGDEKTVVFMSELLVDTETACAVAQAIIDFAQRHTCKRIICIESFAEEIDLDLDEEEAADMSQEEVLRRMLGAMELAGGGLSKMNKAQRKKVLAGAGPSTPELKAKAKDIESKAEAKSSELAAMFVATNDDDTNTLLGMGIHRVKNGIVSGVSGLLIAEAEVAEGIDVILLIGRHHPMLSDARAAVTCMVIISKLVQDLGVTGEQLERRANKLERRIHKAISDMTKTTRRKAPQGMYM